MFEYTKRLFVKLLTCLVSASNHTKTVSLSNQNCMTQPFLTNLHPSEKSQDLCYYLLAVNLDASTRSCNSF